MLFFDIHIVSIFSSVSARKLKCPSSARLGSELSQLGLARVGKFQLKLISTILVTTIRNILSKVTTYKEWFLQKLSRFFFKKSMNGHFYIFCKERKEAFTNFCANSLNMIFWTQLDVFLLALVTVIITRNQLPSAVFF